jgi:hypothetical protein
MSLFDGKLIEFEDAPIVARSGAVDHPDVEDYSDDWYTPSSIFDAIGLTFDLDPCSPGAGHWVPARRVFTIADDGLRQVWAGLVFMNPPFGGREGHVAWLRKFMLHADGVAIVRA